MDTTLILTATEVIDRVRDSPRPSRISALSEQLQLAVHWALLHPCRDAFPAGWEDDHGLFTAGAPLAGAGAPLVDEFAPASFAAALGLSLEAGKQLLADALELDLPTPSPAGPRRTRSACRCGGPGRSPGRPTTCRWRRWRSPTG